MGGMTLADPVVKESELIRLIKYLAGAPGEAPVRWETWLPASAGPRNVSQGYGSNCKMSAQALVPFLHCLQVILCVLSCILHFLFDEEQKQANPSVQVTRLDWSQKTNGHLQVCSVGTVQRTILPPFAGIRLHSASHKALAITLL